MTTVIGIKTNSGLDGIVLASDCRVNNGEDSRAIRKKTSCGDHWAMGHAGEYDQTLARFYGVLRGLKTYKSDKEKSRKIIGSAIKSLYFSEVNELNTRAARNGTEIEDSLNFILATNCPSFGIWYVDLFGNLSPPSDEKDFDYICIGSGSNVVDEYIQSELNDEKFNPEEIDLQRAIYIAKNSIRKSERDRGSGLGFNLLILTEDSLIDWSNKIKIKLISAEKDVLSSIADHYKSPN